MKAAAVILAAGASRRMGSPKALLEYDGATFVDRLISNFELVCSEIIVVLGHDAARIQAGIARGATVVLNPDHESGGQISSLRCGLRAVPSGIDAVFFTPVDYPSVAPQTVEALHVAWDPACLAVVPVHRGKHGHPVLVAASVIPQFLDLAVTAANVVMHSIAGSTRYLEVEDAGVLRDVDDRAAYAALQQGEP